MPIRKSRLVVTGAGGKAFSTGYDMKESSDKPKRSLGEWRARMQQDIRFTYSVWDCSKPVIAMIEGYCLAGGLEFARCFDMRYCADDAKFGAIEARFSNGLATMMLPWLIGQRCRTLDLYRGHVRCGGGPEDRPRRQASSRRRGSRPR